MRIVRIEAEHWRGLEHAALEDLSPHLNLITGPNESGKSRLAQALYFALFESSKGRAESKRVLESWGVGAERPRVRITFELASARYELEKVFLGTGCNTELRGPDGTLQATEAEAHLREMLGTDAGLSSGTKPRDIGIWPLLWVAQGASADEPATSANSSLKARLHDRLTDEIGEVAAGERGQRVFNRVESAYAHFFTITGSERRPLKDARAAAEAADRQLAEARAARNAVAEHADELVRLRERDSQLAERLASAQGTLEHAREQQRETEAAANDLKLLDEQCSTAERALTRARSELERRERLAAEIATQREALDALEQRRSALDAELEVATAARSACEQAATEAERAVGQCRAERTRASRRHMRAQYERQRDELHARLQRVAEYDQHIEALRETLAAWPQLDADVLETLRAAASARTAARAQLAGAAVAVDIRALQPLSIDGEGLAAEATRAIRVDEERRIDIDGIAALEVSPGGGELAQLRERARDAERALDELLEHCRVADVPDAERLVAWRREQEAARKSSADKRGELMPEGREALVERLARLDAEIENIDGSEGDDPDADATELGATAEMENPAQALEAAEAAERAAEQAQRTRRAERDTAVERVRNAHAQLGEHKARAEAQHQALAERVKELDAQPEAAELAADVDAAERDWQEKLARRKTTRERYEALGGEAAALELERAEQGRSNVQAEQETTVRRLIEVKTALAQAGGAGHHEAVQQAEVEARDAHDALARRERDAAAAARLWHLLQRERAQAEQRLARPVIERVAPYLRRVFPGSEVALNEGLELDGLRTAAVEEPFHELSGGAREQLSLLVRIGLSQVLGAEESWPLVLDDVLVNTDPERIKRVLSVLYQASRGQQILLFTCHAPLYDPAGADRVIALEPTRRGTRRDPGDPGSGSPGSGSPGSGFPGSGDPGPGDPGSGDPGSGYPGSAASRPAAADAAGRDAPPDPD